VTDSKPLMLPAERRLTPSDEADDVNTLAAMNE